VDEEALKALHAGRAYHGWAHVEALLELWRHHRGALHDPEAVQLAILYHDAIYDPRRSDNEANSAALLRASEAGRVPPKRLDAAEAMVLATAQHRVPFWLPDFVTSDIRHFLDMDLSILGAASETFAAYDRAIREEYAHVPVPLYRRGRAAVLQRLLDRNPIFLTDTFRVAYEAAARDNLSAALAELAAADGPETCPWTTTPTPAP
jgi:predicted metal-dependent HD superfamily phosphohydrolase